MNEEFKTIVKNGGHYKPPNCEARSKVAFLIPYRVKDPENRAKGTREWQLTLFLKHMIPWLQKQMIEFKIYVVFQSWEDGEFNRAKLSTIGYLEAEKDGPWDCYTVHDIDRLPFNPNITYHCAPHGKTYHYTTFGGDFGGCGSVPGHTMRAINGWSNMFYGWGGEDQDMGWRLIEASKIASDHIFHLIRADPKTKNLNHLEKVYIQKNYNPFNIWGPTMTTSTWSYIHTGLNSRDKKVNEKRGGLLANFTERWPFDGLHNLRYKVTGVVKSPLFTTVNVDFAKKWDVPNDEKTKVNINKLVKSHPCLQSMDILTECYNREW